MVLGGLTCLHALTIQQRTLLLRHCRFTTDHIPLWNTDVSLGAISHEARQSSAQVNRSTTKEYCNDT